MKLRLIRICLARPMVQLKNKNAVVVVHFTPLIHYFQWSCCHAVYSRESHVASTRLLADIMAAISMYQVRSSYILNAVKQNITHCWGNCLTDWVIFHDLLTVCLTHWLNELNSRCSNICQGYKTCPSEKATEHVRQFYTCCIPISTKIIAFHLMNVSFLTFTSFRVPYTSHLKASYSKSVHVVPPVFHGRLSIISATISIVQLNRIMSDNVTTAKQRQGDLNLYINTGKLIFWNEGKFI